MELFQRTVRDVGGYFVCFVYCLPQGGVMPRADQQPEELGTVCSISLTYKPLRMFLL